MDNAGGQKEFTHQDKLSPAQQPPSVGGSLQVCGSGDWTSPKLSEPPGLSEPQNTRWVTPSAVQRWGQAATVSGESSSTAGSSLRDRLVDTEQRGSRRWRKAPALLPLCSLYALYASTAWGAQPALPGSTHCPAWLGGPRPRCLAACWSACSSASGGSLFQREERVRAHLHHAQGGTTLTGGQEPRENSGFTRLI